MARPLTDRTGDRFGELTVLSFHHMAGTKAYWLCRCDCGVARPFKISLLQSGEVKSCGCSRVRLRLAPEEMWRRRVIVSVDGCWSWKGEKDEHGYGFVSLKRDGRRIRIRANRLSWTLNRGAIPEGLSVLHKCDNPDCTRPDHLFLGTQAANVADMVAKRRHGRLRNKVTGITVVTA